MKNISKLIIGICSVASVGITGCIDETFPTNGATQEQLSSSAKATEALLWAMPAYANNFDLFNKNEKAFGYDWGYGSIIHIRDVMTEDMAVISHNYDHYQAWEQNIYMGESYTYAQYIWTYYWKFVQTSNNMIGALNAETANEIQLGYLGVGHAFRAFLYLDMAQMFEFLENDVTQPVNASGNNVLNLTVPIVKENMTEDEARNNPRVTREQMAEFILADLNKAEEYIVHLNNSEKTLPHLGVVYGLKARYYMWLGDYPNAQSYARKAIDLGIYTPMTESQWLSKDKGFNDISVSSWMWGSKMQKEDDVVKSGILNWTSWMSNEAVYGYSSAGPNIMINAKLYDEMNDTDFRKLAWKAPENTALEGKNSYINKETFDGLPAYASLKFRPAEGNANVSNIGSASAYPLMRIEEMYFIEAEATAHQNENTGRDLLVAFMTNYRDPSYSCTATGQELINEIVIQKRIEFWGEGVSFFDVKRLNLPVVRGYEGTNFSETTRFNTTTRPGWMNINIVQTEKNNNAALRGFENPDASGKYTPWIGTKE